MNPFVRWLSALFAAGIVLTVDADAAKGPSAPVVRRKPNVRAQPTAVPKTATKAAFAVDTSTWLGKTVGCLSQEKARAMTGFFAPVVKKHLPTFKAFNAEYLAAADRRAVIRKYLPSLNTALADARAMKVPAAYEAEKASYLRLIEPSVWAIKLYAADSPMLKEAVLRRLSP